MPDIPANADRQTRRLGVGCSGCRPLRMQLRTSPTRSLVWPNASSIQPHSPWAALPTWALTATTLTRCDSLHSTRDACGPAVSAAGAFYLA